MSAIIHPFPAMEKNSSELPVLRLHPGEIHMAVDTAERELSRLGHVYQRGGVIATILKDPATGETRIENLSLQSLVVSLSAALIWEQYDGRKSKWVRVDPPSRHVRVLHESNIYNHLPVLTGLTHQPYLRTDGSLMLTPGYDKASFMFGIFRSDDFPIPECPTRSHAEQALSRLEALLVEFSFATSVDRAAAISALLTAAIRPSLSAAPLFHVRAHMPGSGKSYLCELITAFATPTRGSPTNFPATEEECGKQLLADFMRSPAVIEFDNLTTDLLAYRSLCTALTSEFMSGRILGSSKTITFSTRTLLLSSGNNVGPIKDMTRRCVTINLAPQCETPAAREYEQPDLVRSVLHRRGEFVSAALTLIRAWICAGRPLSTCTSLTSYGDWSELCRQPLLWLGHPDPIASVFETIQTDPDRETLGRLLHAWHETFGRTPTMIRNAVQATLSHNNQELKEVLHDIADERGEINRRRLGWWIRLHTGQIVDGMRFVKSPGNGSAERWSIEVVDHKASVSPVFPTSTTKNGTPDLEVLDYFSASRGY